ncbi:MAG: PQ-loop domain-containing transporter [Pelobium sp.]
MECTVMYFLSVLVLINQIKIKVEDHFITAIGLFAAASTTISFLPQAIKIIKTKNTESISLSMYVSLGLFL